MFRIEPLRAQISNGCFTTLLVLIVSTDVAYTCTWMFTVYTFKVNITLATICNFFVPYTIMCIKYCHTSEQRKSEIKIILYQW